MGNSRFKFRAWDKRERIMVYRNENDSATYWDGVYGSEVELINSLLNDSSYEFMQYTGLKDRNGREIYEGDLLQHPNGTIAEIRYSDYLAAFVAVYAQNGDIEMDFLDKEIVNTCEIVGNIYENPDCRLGWS